MRLREWLASFLRRRAAQHALRRELLLDKLFQPMLDAVLLCGRLPGFYGEARALGDRLVTAHDDLAHAYALAETGRGLSRFAVLGVALDGYREVNHAIVDLLDRVARQYDAERGTKP